MVFYGPNFDQLFYRRVRQIAGPLSGKGLIEIKPEESFGNPQWVGPSEVMEEFEKLVSADMERSGLTEADHCLDDKGNDLMIDSRFWVIRGSPTALKHWSNFFKDQ